jgi:nucleoside phosphorylase
MALAAHDALDDGTVRTLLAPVDPRWDGRPRDTDRGVQGQTAAGVLRAYRRGSPTAAQLDAVVTWMRDPAVHRDAINAAISVLLQLPASAAARALADIQPRLRVATEPVTRGLERVRAMVSHAEEAERSLARLRAEPADALRTVFSADHTPWFKRSNMPAAPTVLLVTAISTEARSVLRALKERGTRMESTVVNGRTVDRGTFAVAGGRSVSLILAQAVEKGPQAMQAMVASLLGELNPALVLMVGVCGGLPEHGAAQNSVVLARQLHNYERRRERGGLPRLTPQVYRCSPAVIDRVNAAERHGALDAAEIGGVRGVKLHLKDMASGEGLVDDLRSPERQLIVALSDDLVGVEMEGHGLYHEMWERALQGRHDVPYAMIKGVGDFCDGQMTTDKDARQDAATRRALELALAIIERW